MRKIGRNEKCYCGSGLKYKKCCINKTTPSINIPQTTSPTNLSHENSKKILEVISEKYNSNFNKTTKPNLSNKVSIKPLSELDSELKIGVQKLIDDIPIYSGECHLTSWMISSFSPQIKSVKGWCGSNYESFEETKKFRDIKSHKKFDNRWITGVHNDNQEFWYDTKTNTHYFIHSWNECNGVHFDIQLHCMDEFHEQIKKFGGNEYEKENRIYIPIKYTSTEEIFDKEEEFGLPTIKKFGTEMRLLQYGFEHMIKTTLEENLERVPQKYIYNKFMVSDEGVGFHPQLQNRIRI